MAADKGALAAMIAGGDKSSGSLPSEEHPYTSFDSLAEAMGIHPSKREVAKSAMKSFIQECMSDEGDAGQKDSDDSW